MSEKIEKIIEQRVLSKMDNLEEALNKKLRAIVRETVKASNKNFSEERMQKFLMEAREVFFSG